MQVNLQVANSLIERALKVYRLQSGKEAVHAGGQALQASNAEAFQQGNQFRIRVANNYETLALYQVMPGANGPKLKTVLI